MNESGEFAKNLMDFKKIRADLRKPFGLLRYGL
jgi:hypothetical protein